MTATADTVVFVGPSLALDRARDVLDADHRGPARRGDIESAVREGARTVVLIDGYLIHEYPPSPMEISHVLRDGVRVIGAASLGALRAVELCDHGMLGIGWVYEQYASGRVNRDDEVVVGCDRRTGRAITIPLINVRYGLHQLHRRGAIDSELALESFARIADMYLEDRTARAVRAELGQLLPAPMIDELLSPACDIKARDAIEALSRLAAEQLAIAHGGAR